MEHWVIHGLRFHRSGHALEDLVVLWRLIEDHQDYPGSLRGFQARVMYEETMTEPIEMKTGDVFEAPSFPCSTRLGNKTSLWQEQDRDTVYHA